MTQGISIRFAKTSDAPMMSRVANRNLVPVAKLSEFADRGFTIWPRSIEAYEAAIEHSSYVAIAEIDDEFVGHFLAYRLDEFKKVTHLMGCEDQISHYLMTTYPMDTIFADQITILPEFQKCGVGRALDQFLLDNADDCKSWVTDIVHEPIRNEASINFFKRRGFLEVVEKRQDDWLLGLYERKIL